MITSIITTVSHNIGDDFVREGILHLLGKLQPLSSIELIHKHSAATSTVGFEWLRQRHAGYALSHVLEWLPLRDRVRSADLLVQSGAPIYWCHPDGPHCSRSEWFGPLVRRRFLPDRRGRRFLNLAGGSCQTYHSDGSEVAGCPSCQAYIREMFDACDLTLLRDSLARTMLNHAGRDAEVLPCTSIFARDRLGIVPQDGEYIVLNFMEHGGHYSFGQTIDAERWRESFRAIARQASSHGRVVVACHTPKESELAREVVPDCERFLIPNDYTAFMNFYARAKFGIVNRVHAGFMMASLGKPVTVIGSDSRALMIQNLNLPHHFVADIDPSQAEQLVETTAGRCARYLDEVEAIRAQSQTRYLASISAALAA